jgi:hypothetical protein
MDQKLKQRNLTKMILIGVAATLTPGGFIVLGMYGIKKLFDKRQVVPSERPEERPVSDS